VLAIIGSGEGDLRETKILDLFKKVYVSNYDMIFMSCKFNTLCLQLMSMHNVFNWVKGGKQTIMGMSIFNLPKSHDSHLEDIDECRDNFDNKKKN
jgi:hypothetical protein